MAGREKSYVEELLERSRQDSRLPPEQWGQAPYDMYCVDPELYERYRDEVLRLGLTYQEWTAPGDGGTVLQPVDHLSDREVAERLGLDEETVRRIRCMAEWDLPVELWRNAAEFKRVSRLERPMGGTGRSIKGEPG
ncbi:MAG: hypothetical protein Kow0092_10830 [Deferrisomatales bacterium]